MALTHFTREFGINDAAVFKLTSDSAGSAPTYASKVDVPGAKALLATLGITIKKLRGDFAVLAADAIVDGVDGSLKWGRHGFDLYSALTTAAVSDSGSTPNQKTIVTFSGTDVVNSVKIEGQTKQVDYVGGDAHIVLYKCTPGSIPFGFAEDDYQEQSLDFTSVALIGTPVGLPAQSWFSIIADETSVSIT